MRNCLKSVSLALALALLGVVGVRADDSTQTANPSLGQVAKQLKAQKAKESKPARVFTNDNLESNAPITISADKNNDAKPSTPPAATAQPESAPHDAEYYRAEMSKLKSHLDTNQRELDVLQQKLGQNQIQYYGDPNKSLQQQYSRDDVNKLTDDITAKKDEVASDNKAIDDLRDQLRHEGGDPGWLR
jgi:predicted RNase H-like nuclease (RuvC/YqgF family)